MQSICVSQFSSQRHIAQCPVSVFFCAILIAFGIVHTATGRVDAAEPAVLPSPARPTSAAPKIECDQPSFSFGEVWAGEKVEHTFVIRNTGNAPLLIAPNGVKPSCGCTVTGKYDEQIEPGKEGRIPVALNTENQHAQVVKQITVESNDPVTPRLQLSLTGKVNAPIAMEPATGAIWGQYRSSSPDTMTVKLTNNLSEPWHLLLKAPTASQPSSFDVTLTETQEGKAASVQVALKKPVQEGSTYAALTFETGIIKHPQLVIPANVYLPPALQVVPQQIVGATTPGQEFQATVQLIYNREGEMNIESIVSSNSAVHAELLPYAQAANRHIIRVVLPGDFAASAAKPPTIDIKTNRHDLPNNGIVSVPIRVHPQTTQPAQVLSPVRPVAVRTKG